MPERAQVGDDAFDGRIGNAIRGRARSTLQGADAEVRRVQVGHFRQPDGVVRMQLEGLVDPGCLDGGLDGGNQRRGTLLRQQSARILDVQRVHVRTRRQRARAGCVVRVVVDRAQREYQRRDHELAAGLLDQPRVRDIRRGIVHGIRQAEPADAMPRQRAIRQRHEIRARGLPGDEAKAGAHELQRRVGRGLGHQPDALPGILALEAHRHAHVRGSGEVDGLEAHPIHHRRDAQRACGVDAQRRPQALVAIAQRSFHQPDVSHDAAPWCRADGGRAAARGSRCRHRRRRIPGPRESRCATRDCSPRLLCG